MTQQRLHELVPKLDNSLKSFRHQEPPWLQIFNSLVFLCSNNLTGTEETTYRLLQVAISSGFLIKIKHLLTIGGPTVEIFARHLLFVALRVEGSKGMEFLRFLLESGVSPDSIDPYDRRSALYQAVRLGNRDAVQLLITLGADPDAKIEGTKDDTLENPLICALDLCHDREIAKMLIDYGADANSGSGKPLVLAVGEGDFTLMRRLLEVGAGPKLLPAGGLSVMYYGIYHHDLSLVNTSIEAGVNSDLLIEELQDTDLEFLKFEFKYHLAVRMLTPLQFAALEGNVDIVKRLIKGGAVLDKFFEPEMFKKMDQTLPFSGILTPLQMSIQESEDEITKILLDAGSTIDFRHPTTATALQLCHNASARRKTWKSPNCYLSC
jgi:ankyrin repeat protein